MLRAFVELLPEGTRAAFEFRHASWFDADVFDVLRARNIALCVADSEKMSTPVETTADYAYFRLRDEGYQQADIERWASTIRCAAGRAGCLRLLQARRAGTRAGVRAAVHRGGGLTPDSLVFDTSAPLVAQALRACFWARGQA